MVEAATAVLLIVRPAAGAVIAFALLTGFTAILAPVVRSGRDVACGCFGGEQPVSGATLIRNGALMVAALIVVVAAGPTDGPAMPGLAELMVVTTTALLALVLLQALTLRATIGSLWVVEPNGPGHPLESASKPATTPTTVEVDA
jgi:hypothetical protein